MDVRELVRSILDGDLLTAREWVSEARRSRLPWMELQEPSGLSEQEMSVAAAVVELLSARSGAEPPPWTANVGAVRNPFVLDPGLEKMPRSFAHAKSDGPEPLRKRNLVALPDFLDVA
jgi:hypothetical protein